MLDWLNPDRERAGEKFMTIGTRVTKILVRRQCYAAEELWDETSNRVCHRVRDFVDSYVGDPALYFYAVAKLVHLEWLKDEKWKKERLVNKQPDPPEPDDDHELIHECLGECLQKLDVEDRELLLKYYEKEKREKIASRKELADKRGITLNNLRMQIHRTNVDLRKCIERCLNAAMQPIGHVLAG